MPFLQVMSNRASCKFSYDNLSTLDLSAVPKDPSLIGYLQALNIARSTQDQAVINAMPSTIQISALSVMRHAVECDVANRKQITFSWAPAYEWGIHIWEARSAGGSPSAITIQLEGPYPDIK
jgi:hypothetical protein